MDNELAFYLCYRHLVNNLRLSPELSRQQLDAILQRVRTAEKPKPERREPT